MPPAEPFSLRARVREVYEEGSAVSPAQIAEEVIASLSAAERRAALSLALPAYVSRFVSQQRGAGVAGMGMVEAPPPAPGGPRAASPIVSGRKKAGYDSLAEALSVRLHGAPGPDGWVTLAEAAPAHLRFAAETSRVAAAGALASAERYERWAAMVEHSGVAVFGKLSSDVLASELLRPTDEGVA